MIIQQPQRWISNFTFWAIVLVPVIILSLLFLWRAPMFLAVLVPPASIHIDQQFSSQPVEVSFIQRVPGTLHYTTDGTKVTPESPRYTGEPLTISQTTTLRWQVWQNHKALAKESFSDIFVGTNHELPIVTITTEPQNLWDQEQGIAVEGTSRNNLQSGKEWERPAVVQYYDASQNKLFSRTIGLRLHGRAQREMPQQSFRLIFQDERGRVAPLEFPLFGTEGNRRYESLVLRNGGGDARFAMVRDYFLSEVVRQSDSPLDVTLGTPVVLYLNGSYWGLYFLQERFDETYFAEKYRVRKDGLAIVEVPLESGELRGQVLPVDKRSQSSATRYNQLRQDAARCTQCLDWYVAQSSLDGSNLVDYFIFELFSGNYDWPYNNIKAWRYQGNEHTPTQVDVIPELDGRFRWLLFDMDVALGSGIATPAAMVRAAGGDPYAQLIDNAFPFRNFFHQQGFQNEYSARVEELLDTTLSSESLNQVLDQILLKIDSEMHRHINRWNTATFEERSTVPATYEEWQNNIANLRTFLNARQEPFVRHTENWMKDH